MEFRRVVTGVGDDGKSHFVSDGPALTLGEAETYSAFVWATDSTPSVPTDGADQATTDVSFLPGPGESRFVVCVFQPGFGVEMPEGGVGEELSTEGARPEISVNDMNAESASLERIIMHLTPTIDYVSVLSGEVDLILDSGEQVTLGPSDLVVQNGTVHGWRNTSDKPVVFAITLLGAPTSESGSPH
jgi:hypothetical protein